MTIHIPSEWVWRVLVKSSLSKQCTIHSIDMHRQFSFVWMHRIRNDWQWPSNRCFMKWWGDESARKLFFFTPGTCYSKSSIYRFKPFKIRPKTNNWMGHLGFTCVLCNCNMSMYTRLHELVCICVFLFFFPLRWRRFFGFIYFPKPRWENHHLIWRELLKDRFKATSSRKPSVDPLSSKIVKHVTFVDSLTLKKKQDTFFGYEIHQVCRLSIRGSCKIIWRHASKFARFRTLHGCTNSNLAIILDCSRRWSGGSWVEASKATARWLIWQARCSTKLPFCSSALEACARCLLQYEAKFWHGKQNKHNANIFLTSLFGHDLCIFFDGGYQHPKTHRLCTLVGSAPWTYNEGGAGWVLMISTIGASQRRFVVFRKGSSIWVDRDDGYWMSTKYLLGVKEFMSPADDDVEIAKTIVNWSQRPDDWKTTNMLRFVLKNHDSMIVWAKKFWELCCKKVKLTSKVGIGDS